METDQGLSPGAGEASSSRYQALYRKFRPETFSQIRGQEAVVTTLKNQVRSGRLGHAYLFTGTRGTGKTTAAKILARAANCEDLRDGDPCGKCASCQRILRGANLNVTEMDAASNNGVDSIREIVSEVNYPPAEGRFRVYIIDEVHMLSAGAFNALLKTLEEPPDYVIFILATTEVHKIPITILSRCQRFDFHRISVGEIGDQLKEISEKEGIPVEDRALEYLAVLGDGSMRDALSLMERCVNFHVGKALSYEMVLEVLGTADLSSFSGLFGAVVGGDVKACLDILQRVLLEGRELRQFCSDYLQYLRDLLLVKAAGESARELMELGDEAFAQLKKDAGLFESEGLFRHIRIISSLCDELRYSTQKRIKVETCLIRLCRPEMERDDSGLRERIRRLEEKLERLENAPQRQVIYASAPPAGTEKREEDEEKRPKVLPPALPEAVRKLAAEWDQAVNCFPPPLREYLRLGDPRVNEEGCLVLAFFEDSVGYVTIKEKKSEVEQLLGEYAGGSVTIKVEATRNKKDASLSLEDVKQLIRAGGGDLEGVELTDRDPGDEGMEGA